jgi:hypothetical protein
MNTKKTSFLVALLWTTLLPIIMSDAAPSGAKKPKVLNPEEMNSVPDSRFRVNLQIGDEEPVLTLEVSDGQAVCVSSSIPRFKGLQGEFQPVRNGVFRVFLQNENYRASQIWIFRADGTAAIREVPDRGENQSAVPIPDDKKAKLNQAGPEK